MSSGVPRGLHYLHQAADSSRQLYYAYFDGLSWTPDNPVSNTNTHDGPSAVLYGGKLYVFHRGEQSDDRLWYNVFDGNTWAGDQHAPDTYLHRRPSVVMWNGLIYCFHRGGGDDAQLWYNTFDGSNWGGDTPVTNTLLWHGPSAVVHDGEVLVFHQGSAGDGQWGDNNLWLNRLDSNGNWSGDTQVQGVRISQGPSAVSAGGSVYCFHEGFSPGVSDNEDHNLWCKTLLPDGSWADDTQIPINWITNGPSACLYNKRVYCFYQGGNNVSMYSGLVGRNWVIDLTIPDNWCWYSPGVGVV
jgi:hypothetical protein